MSPQRNPSGQRYGDAERLLAGAQQAGAAAGTARLGGDILITAPTLKEARAHLRAALSPRPQDLLTPSQHLGAAVNLLRDHAQAVDDPYFGPHTPVEGANRGRSFEGAWTTFTQAQRLDPSGVPALQLHGEFLKAANRIVAGYVEDVTYVADVAQLAEHGRPGAAEAADTLLTEVVDRWRERTSPNRRPLAEMVHLSGTQRHAGGVAERAKAVVSTTRERARRAMKRLPSHR